MTETPLKVGILDENWSQNHDGSLYCQMENWMTSNALTISKYIRHMKVWERGGLNAHASLWPRNHFKKWDQSFIQQPVKVSSSPTAYECACAEQRTSSINWLCLKLLGDWLGQTVKSWRYQEHAICLTLHTAFFLPRSGQKSLSGGLWRFMSNIALKADIAHCKRGQTFLLNCFVLIKYFE